VVGVPERHRVVESLWIFILELQRPRRAGVGRLIDARGGPVPDAEDVSDARINGVDGVIAIINAGARNLGLNESESSALGITLGEGVFKKLKKCRDSVIHAISHNALAGIGLQRERQGRFNETLMTEEALGRLYRHLMALRAELSDVITLAFIHQHFASLPDGDPNKALAETDRSDCSAQFLAHRNLRQALPPLPEFPEESELLSVRDAWLRRICVLEPPPDE